MHEAQLRITHPELRDIPMLEQIWMDVFGDPPELIEAFFDRFDPGLNGWIVRRGTEILSTAYLIHGNLLIYGDRTQPAAYVYAVATPKEHRGKGYGGILMQHFANLAEQRGLLLYTRPASASLFHWYAETMQTVPAAQLAERRIPADKSIDPSPVTRLSPAEYGSVRERMLADHPHILFSEPFLMLQETYLTAENGGYYGCPDGICACEVHGDTLVIKELVAHDDEEAFVQTLLRHFRLPEALIPVHTEGGESQVAYRGDAPESTSWGLLLD